MTMVGSVVIIARIPRSMRACRLPVPDIADERKLDEPVAHKGRRPPTML